jgi:hypothetical protein
MCNQNRNKNNKIMKKKFIRTFHPVGQGAFYTERHILEDGQEYNIVFRVTDKQDTIVIQEEQF